MFVSTRNKTEYVRDAKGHKQHTQGGLGSVVLVCDVDVCRGLLRGRTHDLCQRVLKIGQAVELAGRGKADAIVVHGLRDAGHVPEDDCMVMG